jgi:N-glycosylase/DNA lyase
VKKIISEYKKKKQRIKNRLKAFKKVYKDKDIFSELCFCILTPQSKATRCDKAITELKKGGLLYAGSEKSVRSGLKGRARFHNKKAAYLVAARKLFTNNGKIDFKNKLGRKDVFKTRKWLVRNIKGLGYKEASHFLRNIGLGRDITILDVHVLRNLKRLGVIDKIPASLTEKNYLDVESRMRAFAEGAGIPLEELDLLFWSNETGYVFK